MQTFTLKDINSLENYLPKRIGLTKGHGKDNFCKSHRWADLSLSTPIKKMLEHIIPKLYIYEEKENRYQTLLME